MLWCTCAEIDMDKMSVIQQLLCNVDAVKPSPRFADRTSDLCSAVNPTSPNRAGYVRCIPRISYRTLDLTLQTLTCEEIAVYINYIHRQ